MWHVTNNKLYSGSDTSTPVFIVGTLFRFNASTDGTINAADISNWTNFQVNRSNAGNAVFMCGNYLAGHHDDGTPASYPYFSGISGGQQVLEMISSNSSIPYFAADVNQYDYQWESSSDNWIPRGSHTTCSMPPNWTLSGHWRKLPAASSGNNAVNTDLAYLTSNSNDSSKWRDSNWWGSPNWHSNWLNRIKTGTAGGSQQYSKIFCWPLIDEPFNPDFHRDAVSNQYSVQGHSAFCSGIESTDSKPKMVGLAPTNGGSRAETGWSNLSNNMDIVGGNNYGYILNDPGSQLPWTTVNMTKWIWSKVSGYTTKMVMPWLPGFANSNTANNASNGWHTCWYTFYGSIIEGARGILWYMTDDSTYSDYANYSILTNVYSAFNAYRPFKGGTAKDPDRIVILNGSNAGVSWVTNPSLSLSPANAGFPLMLSNKFSALAMKYNSRYRLFIVNHSTADADFAVRINNQELVNSGWSNAYDQDGNLTTMTYDGGLNQYRLSGTLSGYYYRIYDIGAGNQ